MYFQARNVLSSFRKQKVIVLFPKKLQSLGPEPTPANLI